MKNYRIECCLVSSVLVNANSKQEAEEKFIKAQESGKLTLDHHINHISDYEVFYIEFDQTKEADLK